MAAGASGEAAAQATQEGGGGTVAQLIASLLAGGGVSAMAARREAAKQSAARAASGATGAGKGLTMAEKLAAERVARSGFGVGGISSSSRTKGVERLRQGADLLDEEVAARAAGELPLSPSTILSPAAPNVNALQRGLARTERQGAELSADLAAQRLQTEGRIGAGAAIERAGAPEALADSYTAVHDELAGAVNDAYKEYRRLLGTDPPPIAIVPLRRRAAKIVREAGIRFPSDALPNPTNPSTGMKLLDDIMETRELSLKELEQLRKLATNSAAQASMVGNKALARNWYELRNGVEDTMTHYATTAGKNSKKVEALRAAIGKRAELGRLFDEKHAASKMFEYDVLVDGMKKRVLGAKDPAGEIRRIRMIIAQSDNAPEATKALQSVVFDSVFGPQAFMDATEGAMKKAQSALLVPRNRLAIDGAYGTGHAQKMAERFARGRRALSEGVGTKGETLRTGSNIAAQLWGTIGVAQGLRLTKNAAKKLAGVSDEKVNEALIRFYREPEYAARLLRAAQESDYESLLGLVGKGVTDTSRPVVTRIGELAEGGE
ncbi:MAG: hypothetical protein A2W26_03505 [Acidobacteria bacterium RBG_16_64_8]|nr:MAG: hypothetical protein A2W26_03505 [Acidobacteria bacterium RBG_16_64_8]